MTQANADDTHQYFVVPRLFKLQFLDQKLTCLFPDDCSNNIHGYPIYKISDY